MKNIAPLFTIAIFVLSVQVGNAQVDSLWSRTYGGPHGDICMSMQQTADSGFILAGSTFDSPETGVDFWLVKTDAEGNSLWSRRFGGTSTDQCYSVQQTTDGGYIMAGYSSSFTASVAFWVVKVDADGDSVWAHSFDGSNGDVCYAVQQTNDGGYILAGHTRSYGAGSYDYWLIKTDGGGGLQWSRTFGGPTADKCHSVRQTTDGGYILSGTSRSADGETISYRLLKTNANGDSVWSATFGEIYYLSDSEYRSSVLQTADGGYLLAASFLNDADSHMDFGVIKTDAFGNELWPRTYGRTGYEDSCLAVQPTSDGGYILAGNTRFFGPSGSMDAWIVKINENGDSLWSRVFGGTSTDSWYSVCQTFDDEFAFAGYTASFGMDQGDFWLLKAGGGPEPEILSIRDVGNDQGRNVRLRWRRSIWDSSYPDYTITDYSIYRRIDQYVSSRPRPSQSPILEWPPGDWEFVTSVPAYGEYSYATIVPTLADSNSMETYWSVFFIRAATSNPLIHFDSPVDSGYSIDNLAPDPTLLVADLNFEGGNLVLHWEEVTTGGGGQPENNGIWYRVHGDTDPDFIPNESNLLTVTQQLSYVLPVTEDQFYFKVLVSDDH